MNTKENDNSSSSFVAMQQKKNTLEDDDKPNLSSYSMTHEKHKRRQAWASLLSFATHLKKT
jgi:hypothetical protein